MAFVLYKVSVAIYHFSGTLVSRSQGRSAVACAAYRAGEKLYDERLEKIHDYTKKHDVAYRAIVLPEGAPAWLADRETLWNTVEAVEKRKDAQLAREFNAALPRELTLAQHIELANAFVREQFVKQGMVADIALHHDKAQDGEPQPHLHVMLTLRAITSEGFGPKVREWNQKAYLLTWREAWANAVNHALAQEGLDIRIDHRTLEAQGIALEPQHKLGVGDLQASRLADHQRIAWANGERLRENPALALEALTYQQSTFTHQDIARFIHRHTGDAQQFTSVYEKVKACPSLVRLGHDDKGRERFTTQSLLALEERLISQAEGLANRPTHAVDALHAKTALACHALSEEQQLGFEHLVAKGDLKCVVGYAGTGKSYLLGAARAAWEAEGYYVRGVTLSGIAAETLTASSGIKSRTLASLTHYWDKGERLLTRQAVLVVDEAGMLGSRQLERVITHAREQGAKVVLVGDPEQLQAIEAGAAFRAVLEQVGHVALTDIRRQQAPWQQQATKDLATGKTLEALTAYAKKDHVHRFVTQAEAQQALVTTWHDVRISEPAKAQIMLAYTRKEVQTLNTLARDLRRKAGELGEDQPVMTVRGERAFAVGDRLYCLKNDRGLGVMNGTLATVDAIDGERLTLRLDTEPFEKASSSAKPIQFDVKEYPHLDYGYAATLHKAQGVTVDRSLVLASRYFDRHTTYVALSRHRESVELFWSQEVFGSFRTMARALSEARPKEMALDYFAKQRGLLTPDRDLSLTREGYTQYQALKQTFKASSERQENALMRIQTRLQEKALAGIRADIEKRYGQSFELGIPQGTKAYYHETFVQQDRHYALLEHRGGLSLVEIDKSHRGYCDAWVKAVNYWDNDKRQKTGFVQASSKEMDFVSTFTHKMKALDLELER